VGLLVKEHHLQFQLFIPVLSVPTFTIVPMPKAPGIYYNPIGVLNSRTGKPTFSDNGFHELSPAWFQGLVQQRQIPNRFEVWFCHLSRDASKVCYRKMKIQSKVTGGPFARLLHKSERLQTEAIDPVVGWDALATSHVINGVKAWERFVQCSNARNQSPTSMNGRPLSTVNWSTAMVEAKNKVIPTFVITMYLPGLDKMRVHQHRPAHKRKRERYDYASEPGSSVGYNSESQASNLASEDDTATDDE
jgi:hypothetical protein